jgi:hypothetical protein
MKQTFVAAMSVLGFTAASLVAGVNPASADPNTCSSPYVWRNARPGDAVCVTNDTRRTVAGENANPRANKQPGGGAYGPDTCAATFVWREAFPGDTICVSTQERDGTLADNAAAASRLASATCQKWRPAGPVISLAEDNGVNIGIEATAQTLGPSATASGPHQPSVNGPAKGSIQGNKLQVNINFDNGWQTGGNITIAPDGSGNGNWSSFPPAGLKNANGNGAPPIAIGNWHALDKFLCDH